MSDDPWEKLLNAPVVFGLEAQGKIPTIEKMLAEGKSWDDIGKAIGWMPDTAREHYGRYLIRTQKHGLEPGLHDLREDGDRSL